eukprot:2304122-Amphidinium_carterae.1
MGLSLRLGQSLQCQVRSHRQMPHRRCYPTYTFFPTTHSKTQSQTTAFKVDTNFIESCTSQTHTDIMLGDMSFDRTPCDCAHQEPAKKKKKGFC